jgi:pimeloyl-ACP methyl ester carboxylesterase
MQQKESPKMHALMPRTHHEGVILGIFSDTLGIPVDRIGIDALFSELGGRSASAAQLASRIGETFGIEPPVQLVSELGTIERLGEWVEEKTKRLPQGKPLALRSEGKGFPLFCIHPSSGFGRPYRVLLPHLSADMAVYALEARGMNDGDALPATLAEMCSDYIAQIQRIQGNGPYHLLGWSFGAIPAHAIATEMQRRGLEVGGLILIDGFPFDGTPWVEQLVSSHRDHWRNAISEFAEMNDASDDRHAIVLERLCAIKRNNVHLQAYEDCCTFVGDALLVDCGTHPFSWGDHVSGTLMEVVVPFGHNALMMPEAAAFYGPKIADYLAKSHEAARSPQRHGDRVAGGGIAASGHD